MTAEAPAAATPQRVALGNPTLVWGEGQERRLDLIRRWISLEGASVLDIGCGIGAYTRRLGEFSDHVYGIDIDARRIRHDAIGGLASAVGERLPFRNATFDVVLLNEVIEHVNDDAGTLREACRVLRPGGHIVIFAPNRLYPFETHGIYIHGRYVFGNIPLVNYLPDVLRNRLAPHARAYTSAGLRRLVSSLPADVRVHSQVYPGFDRIAGRGRRLGQLLRTVFHRLERTPLRAFGLSHFMILKTRPVAAVSDRDGHV